MSPLTALIEGLPDDALEALAERLAERLQRRQEIVSLEQFAKLHGITVRQARGLREKGLPACNLRPQMYDLRVTDKWFESRRV